MVMNHGRHHRRSVRLKGYDYAQAGAYFVTICIQGRACLFGDVVNRQMRVNKCGQVVADSWLWLSGRYPYVGLDEWVVMPNHLHGIMILTEPGGRDGSRTAPTENRKSIGRLIGAFKTVSTKRLNEMRNTPGVPVWQRNYYEHIIRSEESCTVFADTSSAIQPVGKRSRKSAERRGASRSAPTQPQGPMTAFTESIVEDASLAWLEALGYQVLHGPDIAVGELAAERTDPNYRDVILERRLREALIQLNPDLPSEAIESFRKLTRTDAATLIERNRAVHRMLVDGVTVEYRRKDGSIAGAQARVLDYETPDKNDWLAVNQFTVYEGQHTRRPDVVLFVNGLPLAVIELKNPADEDATIWSAYQQLQTYQLQIPSFFATNAALIVSDGVQARIGTLGAGKEWFKPWRTIGGREDAPSKLTELQVVLEGVFEKRRFLDLVRHFVVFEDEGHGKLIKKMAGYHQFHAVNVAVEETLRAARHAAEHRAADPLGQYKSGHRGLL